MLIDLENLLDPAIGHDMARGGSGNGHYGGNAKVYMDVGEAMGKAMVELLKK